MYHEHGDTPFQTAQRLGATAHQSVARPLLLGSQGFQTVDVHFFAPGQ